MPDLLQARVNRKQNPLRNRNIVEYALLPAVLFDEAAMGSIKAAIQGKNVLKGLSTGLKERTTFSDVLNTLEKQKGFGPKTPFIGSKTATGFAARITGSVFFSSANLLPFLGSETSVGRAIREAPLVSKALAGERDFAGLRGLLRGVERGGLTAERFAQLPHRTRKATTRITEAAKVLGGRLPAKKAATLVERVATGQQRFIFTGENTAKAISLLSKTASTVSSFPIVEPALKGARKATNVVFGRLLDKTKQAVRGVLLHRANQREAGVMATREKIIEMAALAQDLTKEQIKSVEEVLGKIYATKRDLPVNVLIERAAGKEKKIEQVSFTIPKGTTLHINVPDVLDPLDVQKIIGSRKGTAAAELTANARAVVGNEIASKVRGAKFEVPLDALRNRLEIDPDHPAFRGLISTLASGYAKRADMDRSVAVLENVLSDYVPVNLNPKAMKLLGRGAKTVVSKDQRMSEGFSTWLAANKKKTVGRFSASEMNEAIRQAAESGNPLAARVFTEVFQSPSLVRDLVIADPKGFGEFVKHNDIFIENPLLNFALRELKGIKAVTNEQAAERMLRTFAVPIAGKKMHSLRDAKIIRSWIRQNGGQYSFYVPRNALRRIFAKPEDLPDGLVGVINQRAGVIQIGGKDLETAAEFAEDADKVRGFVVPWEIGTELNRFNRALEDESTISGINKAIDLYASWWKQMNLLMVPAFYTRNAVTDLTLLWVAGAGEGSGPLRAASIGKLLNESGNAMLRMSAKDHPKLGQFMDAVTGGRVGTGSAEEFIHKSYVGSPLGTTLELMQQAQAHRIWRRGWTADFLRGIEDQHAVLKQMGVELERTPDKVEQAKTALSFLFGSRNPILKTMGRFGSFMEGQIRFASFLDRMKKGDSAAKAADFVRRTQYVLDEITPFDRAARRIMFFWTWKKFEIPAVIDAVRRHPELLLQASNAARAFFERLDGEGERARIRYVRKAFGIPIRPNEKTGEIEFFLPDYWLPGPGLAKLFTRPGSLFDELNPLITQAVEQTLNVDNFRERPVARDVAGESGFVGPIVIPEMFGISGKRIASAIRDILPTRALTVPFEQIGGIRGEINPDRERGFGSPTEIMLKTLGLRLHGVKKGQRLQEIRFDLTRQISEYRREKRNLLRNNQTRRVRMLDRAFKSYVQEVREEMRRLKSIGK